MTLLAGARLSSYEIIRPIAAGGMGEVYRARDTKLSRDVAIKVLPEALAGDAERLARFEKEARMASALNHPNIVTIYEIGHADGTSFIAMELVEGKTLRELVAAGPIPIKRLLSLAAQMAEGLARAHAAGIVHRDLKPENLMVTREGFVKILDFGLAKLVRTGFEASRGAENPTVSRGTEAGTILGTVGYMSPEQASGEPADFRSDQFSFGSILYEMIIGGRAFERSTPRRRSPRSSNPSRKPLATAAPRTPAQARLDRRAVPLEGSRGAIRLDHGPGARSGGAARPRLGHFESAASSRRPRASFACQAACLLPWRSRSPACWLRSSWLAGASHINRRPSSS